VQKTRDRPIYQPDRYLGFTDILVLAKVGEIGLASVHVDKTVILLTPSDDLCKKAQRTKSRQLSCSNTSRYVFINK